MISLHSVILALLDYLEPLMASQVVGIYLQYTTATQAEAAVLIYCTAPNGP